MRLRRPRASPTLASLTPTAFPTLQAAEGSTHGYDVIDHSTVNRELGGEEAFGRFVEALREHQLGQVVDVVPYHMAISDAGWRSVAARGGMGWEGDEFSIFSEVAGSTTRCGRTHDETSGRYSGGWRAASRMAGIERVGGCGGHTEEDPAAPIEGVFAPDAPTAFELLQQIHTCTAAPARECAS